MLWSLLKILVFVAIVAALAYGAGFLMESDEGIRIAVANMEFTFGPLQAVIVMLVLLALVWLTLRIAGLIVAVIRFLTGDETALSRYFDRNRERKGYQALADAMMALASGESRLASVRAAKAEKLLGKPELTNLITAQAAEQSGDKVKATAAYKRLLAHDASRFVGVTGLMKQKLEAGDTDTALKLAEKALVLKPKHEATQDTVLRLQAEGGDWTGARATLNTKLRHGSLPRPLHKRRDAVLALSEAQDAARDGDTTKAENGAIEANKMSPELIPAAVMAAETYTKRGKPRVAAKIIKKAWSTQSHPDLAVAFANIAPDEKPIARINRFGVLTNMKPDDAETRMLKTELHIADENFPAARKALGDLPETDPSVRSLTLMAAIERGEGADDAAVRAWLTKALTASRGPQWVCENCSNPHTEWTAICLHCGGFDTLSWKVPPAKSQAMPASTEFLPLIVGAPAALAEPETEDVAVIEDTVDPATGQEAVVTAAMPTVSPDGEEAEEKPAEEAEVVTPEKT